MLQLRHSLSLLFVLALYAAPVRAEPLRIDQSAERMRVDGALREWKGARFATLGSGDDASLRFALATASDGKGLYVAAEIADDRLVRKAGVGARQDALVLSLAMPTRGEGFHGVEIWLHPGEMGKSKAQAGIGSLGGAPRVTGDIEIVEGPRDAGGGYVIEAFVPFRLVPGSEIWDQGRGSLRFEDVDSESRPTVESVLSTQLAQKASELPRLAMGTGQKDFLGGFLSSQGLAGSEPRYDFRGQVAGDSAPERVVIVERYVLVYGPHFKQGNAFASFALPLGSGGGIKSAELTDLTADGIEELAVVVRQRNELGARDVWFAVSFASESPQILFGIELRKEANGGFIEVSFELERKGRAAPVMRVKPGRSAGLTAETFRETRSADVQPILLPWEGVLARSYQFDGTRFSLLEEKRDPKAVEAKPAPAAKPAPQAQVMEPIEPSVDAVLLLFKEQRGLPKRATASRHLRANLLGSRALEDLFVFGVQLVVIGPDLGGGGSYFAYGLPITDPNDLLHVGTDDVTGDGRAEVFVRVRQSLSGVDGVKRGVMLVHRFDEEQRFSRVLSVEAFRYQGTSRVANSVSTARGSLVVSPGTAHGFGQHNFPFVDEAVGGVGRLLLPWKDKPVRYRLKDGTLVPTP